MPYCWSRDEEGIFRGDCTTREEAVQEFIDNYDPEPGTVFYTAESVEWVPAVCAVDVLDQVIERAQEEVGEASESWEPYRYRTRDEALQELTDNLTDVLSAWLKKHGREPDFFAVRDVQLHEAPVKGDE